VLTIQRRTFDLHNRAMDALTAPIGDIEGAGADGRAQGQLASARDFQRKSHFHLDFAEAENPPGVHAPHKAARILAESIDFIRHGQLALREPRPR
jgi:formate-dependent nitrite reductase cytochrome c552 subunit